MKIQLSDHFTYKRLLLFTIPSIGMMIFTSIYGVVDGLFVSNFVGKTPFAAINLIMPFLMMFGALGFMIGAGGTAVVAITLGEGKKERANGIFSMLIYLTIILGALLSTVGILFLRPVAVFLGAEGTMVEDCVIYGRILLISLVPFMLQNTFQTFLIAAEKPKLGLVVTVAAGITNMILDALFVAIFHWGLVGAAVATALSQCVGGVIPFVYFSRPNNSLLSLGKPVWSLKAFVKTCTNGSSELMSNISMSLVGMLYNFQLLRYAGEDGVAAYGVIMYVNFIFIAVLFGYAMGAAPVVSFHYGAGNTAELKNLRQKSLRLIFIGSVVLTLLAEVLAEPLAQIFVGYDAALFNMTRRAFRIYSLSFLVCGFNIFGSSFFTALGNGLISALISFLRTMLLQVGAVLLLPMLVGLDGIWFSVLAAEAACLALTGGFLMKMQKKYQY